MGTAGFGAWPAFATGTGPASVASGDFDLDGKPDLAVANAGANTVSVLLGQGDGSFAPKVDHVAALRPSSVAVGDFNLDDRADLTVAAPETNGVTVLLGKGDGTFPDLVYYATADGPRSVAVGDIDADGKPDLAVANAPVGLTSTVSITVTVLLGNGDGSFRINEEYATGSLTGPGGTSVAVGDFNVDRKLDLAVANYDSDSVSVLLGNGDGTFGDVLGYATGRRPSRVVVGDFNLDGKPDLAVADDSMSPSGAVSVLLGRGDGSFADKLDYGIGDGLGPVAVGDFNLDGKPDLALARSTFGGTVSVLLGNGDGTFTTRVDHVVQEEWQSALSSMAVSDIDLDGKPDIAVTDFFFDTVTVLLGRCL
jgi:hypothetical protein